MRRGLGAVLAGEFVLRFSTGLTGTALLYYLADLPRYGGAAVGPVLVGVLGAVFFVAELVLAPPFGIVSDRLGQRPVMQVGPLSGGLAVVLTGLTTHLPLLGLTRLLEGSSTAASVPAMLGYLARATAGDEPGRGRAAARFELATLGGLGAGLVAAGPLYATLGRATFFANALVYGACLLILRFGVTELPERARGGADAPIPGPGALDLSRYRRLLSSSHALLLAPTWIAVNAVLGLWSNQTLFELVRRAGPRTEPDQLLMGGFSPTELSIALAGGLVVFFAGMLTWGSLYARVRRTTLLGMGIGGGVVAVVFAGLLNHSAGEPSFLQVAWVAGGAAGLFVLSAATPAALGLLADLSEAFPADRGALMGLYSVFLSAGQIVGSLVGGVAGQLEGLDAILVATLVLIAVAVLPLRRLRAVEHRLVLGEP